MTTQGHDEPRYADTTGTLSDDDTYLVPALERGLRILELFNARDPVLTPNLIAQRLGLPRTTALRLVQTLQTLGYLERANRDRDVRLARAS
uniref:helix-turn-helix domain-containing protein n=1 Tax=Burkholderia cenocepacia TaxID=95486 RepID=UPI0038B6BE25